jgi:hypothetical protein
VVSFAASLLIEITAIHLPVDEIRLIAGLHELLSNVESEDIAYLMT